MRPEKELFIITAKGAQRLYRRIGFIMLLIPVLLIPTTSNAAKTSYTGLSGLPYMNTADVAAKGELDVHFRTGMEKFDQDSVVDHVGKSALGVTYGLIDGLELAGQIPHSYKEGKGYSGIPYFTMAAKYRFLGGQNKSYAMAVSAVGNVGASDEENNIGSGESGYSLELNASLYGGSKVGWHIMLGREKSDRKSFNAPTSTAGLSFESVTKNKLALGFEYEMDPDLFLSLEAEGSITTEDEDDNGILSLGIRYQADTALSYVLGFGFGLPDKRSQPQVQAFVGITYSFGKPHAQTRAPTRAAPRIPSPGYIVQDDVEERADSYDEPGEEPQSIPGEGILEQPRTPQSRMQLLEMQQPRVQQPRTSTRKTKPAPRRKYVSNVRIEIWNASGIKGLGRKVANRLKQRGYRVVRVKKSKRRQKQTMVFYAPGYSKQAVKIGHNIWKEQDVRGTKKLKKGIEIQIVVGHDLKK